MSPLLDACQVASEESLMIPLIGIGMANAFSYGMTKLQTINTIKGLGLTARWNSEYHEFVINYRRDDSRRTELSDYHTDDAQDALDTARAMIGRTE